MKFEIDPGPEFDVTRVEILKAKSEYWAHQSKTLARLIATVFCAVFIAAAAILGLLDGSFDELSAVWYVAGPLAFFLVGYAQGEAKGTKDYDDTG
jgi:hypothetical protein